MPIHKSKSCKKVGGEEERSSRIGVKAGSTIDHHARVLMEESMVISFFTNLIFFFVGNVTILMPYPFNNFYLVVLVLCTHWTFQWKGSRDRHKHGT